MPLSFEEAKRLVNPDPLFKVSAGSQEHRDIIELMRQSGFVPASQRSLPTVKKPTHPRDFNPIRVMTRQIKDEKKPLISKQEWLSIKANKDAFDDYLNKNKNQGS